MPEGPEVRRAADRIQRALGSEPLREVWFAFEHLHRFGGELSGQRISAIKTQGKAFLIYFESDLVLYVHLQLYGKWMFTRDGQLPATRRQLRVALHGTKHSALLYSASEIALLTRAAVPLHPYIARLGPDLLDPDTTKRAIIAHATAPDRSGRRLGTLLLEQSFLAGVGNYLRSEILFAAGLMPHRRPRDCSPDELQALAQSAVEVTQRAYVHAGVTTPRAMAIRLKESGLSRRAYRHMVFGRANQPCRVCGSSVEKTIDAGRRLYHCRQCQN